MQNCVYIFHDDYLFGVVKSEYYLQTSFETHAKILTSVSLDQDIRTMDLIKLQRSNFPLRKPHNF